jgi:glycosyltransferase involved in cell wall biosynthesis
MKIAHINNTSGIGSALSRVQRLQGHLSDVYVFNRRIYNQFGGIMINYRSPFSRWKVFRRLQEYDAWHYHYPYGSLRVGLEKRKIGKIYIKHYHGDDVRGKHDDDFCLVSTPDLLEYAPNGTWLPSPVYIDELVTRAENKRKGKLRIAHYPYYKVYGHDDVYSTTLDSLQETGKCDIIKVLGFSYEETLRLISTCDIVIGKIIPKIGWFGRFELEGMARGKPVIAYVSDKLYDKYKPPIFLTTMQNFSQDLETLIEDASAQQRLSKEGMEYVKKYHSPEKIGVILEGAYKRMNP